MKFDRYDTPQVRPQGVDVGPGSERRVTHVSGAQEVVEGLNKISGAANTFREAEERDNKIVAKDRDNKFSSDLDGLMTEQLAKEGENALDTTSLYEKAVKLRAKHEASLATQESRALFAMDADVRMGSLRTLAERHATDQRKKLHKATVATALTGAERDAVRVYNDEGRVDQQIAMAVPAYIDYLRDEEGLPPEVITERVQAFAAKVYESVLQEYKARKQFMAGREYLKSTREVLGTKAAEWEAAFNTLGDAEIKEAEGSRVWNEIYRGSVDSVKRRFNEDAASAALEEYPPDVRALVRPHVESEIKTARLAQDEADKSRLARIDKYIRATGQIDFQGSDYVDLDDQGQATALRLLASFERERRSDDLNARRVQADIDAMAESDFIQLGAERMATMTEDDVRRMFPDASKRKVKYLAGQVGTKARKAVDAGLAVSHDQFLKYARDQAHGFPQKQVDEKIIPQLETWWQAEAADGKDPDEAVVADKIARLLLRLEVPAGDTESLLGVNKYAFQVQAPANYAPAALDEQPIVSRTLFVNGKLAAPPLKDGTFLYRLNGRPFKGPAHLAPAGAVRMTLDDPEYMKYRNR